MSAPKFSKPRLLSEKEINIIRGKALVGHATPQELMQVFDHWDLTEAKMTWAASPDVQPAVNGGLYRVRRGVTCGGALVEIGTTKFTEFTDDGAGATNCYAVVSEVAGVQSVESNRVEVTF